MERALLSRGETVEEVEGILQCFCRLADRPRTIFLEGDIAENEEVQGIAFDVEDDPFADPIASDHADNQIRCELSPSSNGRR